MGIKPGSRELLKDKRVIEEINRHLWIESEKAGHDIGFEAAAEDWLRRFSGEWLKYHTPETNSDGKGMGKSRARRLLKLM